MRTEIRHAIRGLLRDRVFALMIVLSLAVGIGANTAIFSLVNGVLLQPPDFPHPERLVALTQWAPKLLRSYPVLPVNIDIYAEWRKQMTSFESGIYRSDVVGKNQIPGRDRATSRWSAPCPGKRTRREDHALLIVRDEFRPAIPRSGCSPAEPGSASTVPAE